MKSLHVISRFIWLCLFLTACTHQPHYQLPSSDKAHATLNVDLVDGGFMKVDKPAVKVVTINGFLIEDWGGGIIGRFHDRSFDIPAGPVFIEVPSGYVRFPALPGEAYTLSFHESPHDRFTLIVNDSAGRTTYSHAFLQPYRCTYGNTDTRLIDAIAFLDVGKVKKLLDERADPNRLKCHAWHPLPLAAKENSMEILKLLLAAGAQADGFDGVKAMRHSLENDNLDMMMLLVANGADINLREAHFVNSLLMDAAEQGSVRFVKFFLEHGAYTKFRNRNGKTASLLAEEAGYIDIADLINGHAD